HFFAAESHDTPEAFFIKNSCIISACFHVSLVSADNPVGWIDDSASVLDAGVGEALVVAGNKFERAAKFKIARCSVGPNEEGVSFGRVFSGSLAGNRTLLYGPEFGIAVPPVQIFAVEHAAESLLRTAIIEQGLRLDRARKTLLSPRLVSRSCDA